jgi:hypothetical protein
MSFTRWLTSVHHASHSKNAARRRRVNPLSGLHNWLLEERCLLSRAILPHHSLHHSVRVKAASQSTIYVDNRACDALIGPYTLENVAPDAGAATF